MDYHAQMAEAIAVIPFPVYGVVGEPLGLKLLSYGSFGSSQPFNISYESPHYPAYSMGRQPLETFRIVSWNAQRHIVRAKDYFLEKIIEGQEQPVRNPFRWEGTLTIAETLFSGFITYYASPLLISGFCLTSGKTLISGISCGPNVDELVQLLESLQVLSPTS